jgi:hypothetical protein
VNSLETAVTERIAFKCVTEKKVRLHFAKQKKQQIFKIAIASTIAIVTIKPAKLTHYNILISNTATYFGPHWSFIMDCCFTEQSLGQPVISNIQ